MSSVPPFVQMLRSATVAGLLVAAAGAQAGAQSYPSQTAFIRAEPAGSAAEVDVPPPPRWLQDQPHKHGMPPVPYAENDLPLPDGPPTRIGTAGPGAPCTLTLRKTVTVAPGGNRSTISEPTMAFAGTTDPNATTGFFTANWFAGHSTNAGTSWSHTNPYTKFAAVDGGFCCDQRTLYEPSRNMMVWYLQYSYSATTQRGSARVAYAIGSQIPGNSWASYVFTPQFFGRPAGEWLDYPDMAVSDDRIYWSSNIFNAGGTYQNAVIWTMSLAQFAAGSGSVNWWFTSNVGGGGSIRFTRGGGPTVYAGTHRSSVTLRVYKLTGTSLVGLDRTHPTWVSSGYSSLAPNGVNWAGRIDSRITGGYHAHDEYAFLWTCAATTNRPQPYVRVARFRVADDSHIADDEIWSGTAAFMYPAAAANDAGHKGFVVSYGGPGTHPSTACGLVDDCYGSWWGQTVAIFAGANASPSRAAWGDYFSVERHPVRSMSFVGSGMGMNGGSADGNQTSRFTWFNRERDNPAWMTVAIHSAPVQGIPIQTTNELQGRTSVTTVGYASFTPAANYILTAPLTHTAGGTVYRFKRWNFRTAPYGALQQGYSTARSTLFIADARDDIAEAEYDTARRVDIGSRNPTSGIAITVSTADAQGNGNGTTPFSRHYVPGASTTLTAPATYNTDHPFKRWWLNGAPQALGTRTLNVSVAAGTTPLTAEAEYYTHVHGSLRAIGAGCPGSNNLSPTLGISHPDAGSNVTYSISNAYGPTGGALYIGASSTTWSGVPLPLNLGFIGMGAACFLRVSLDATVPIAITASGSGSVALTLPASLPIGTKLYFQGRVLDPLVTTPLPIVHTNAIEMTTGGNQ